MKSFRPLVYVFFVVSFLGAAFSVYADTAGTTNGKLGELLSIQLYCGVKDLLQGNVGLLLGLLIMFSALWSLTKGGKVAPAVISIIFGALITALPSLIESSMGGFAQLLKDTGMANENASFESPKQCRTVRQQIDDEFKRAEENKKLGLCYGGLDCK